MQFSRLFIIIEFHSQWFSSNSSTSSSRAHAARSHLVSSARCIVDGSRLKSGSFLTARRCASAVLATALCRPTSVCLSQARVMLKRLDGSSCFFVVRCFPRPVHTLSSKENWISPKGTVLLLGTLSQTLDLENIAAAR